MKRMGIAERIDALMQKRNLKISQSALARLSGVPQSTVNRILKGGTVPELATVRKLAAALNVSALWLVGESDDMNEGVQRASEGWPFRLDKARIDALTSAEKEILDGILEAGITAIEAKRGTVNKKGSQRG